MRFIPVFLLMPTAALAHSGPHFWPSVMHLLTEPDHLVMLGIGAIVVVYVVIKRMSQR